MRQPHAHPIHPEPEPQDERWQGDESFATALLGMAALVALFILWFVVLVQVVP